SGEKDVRLTRVSIPSSVLKDATVIADVQIEHRGMGGNDVTVEIEDAGRILARQTVQLQRGVDVTHASLSFPASERGARRLRARIAPVNGEKQLQNNERQALISVRDNREKILLVDGEPRFEDKFIRRALTGENNLQLVQLLRTAPKKYYRLDVDSAGELVNGFPTSRTELFKYRALILGSIEASFFTHDQLQMIAEFVSVRGGGLLALGGPKALAEGSWSGTAVADALPVEIERGPAAPFSLVRVFPTQAGATHPVTQLDSTTAASLEHWRRLPPLSVTNIVGALKPGATALLADSSNTPVLAYHRFGRGAAFVFTPQDSWLWQMHKDVTVEDETHETFWRQLLRYLVQDSNDRVQLVASQSARVQQAMSLTASVTDTAFQSLNDAQVTATVRAPDGTAHVVPLTSAGQNFEGSFTPTLPGVHEVAIEAKRGGAVLGETLAYINAGTEDLELFDPVARPSTLKRIADETGGRFYTPNKAGSIAEDISLLGHGLTVQQQKELWDMPAVFLIMLIALCAEWLYRRKQGLA
ncbi:MAG TPA: hypothetical protein VM100_09460, partial [Longimicrobiales bacterium]|nr:hypothetical protein [Longimicrobiales bacterium]